MEKTMDKDSTNQDNTTSFEQRLHRLEMIATELRNDAVPIDDATRLFEEGLALSKKLQSELADLEQRIEILTNPPESEDVIQSDENITSEQPQKPGPERSPDFTLFDDES